MSVTPQVHFRILERKDGKRILQQKWMGTRYDGHIDGTLHKTIVEEWRSIPLVKEEQKTPDLSKYVINYKGNKGSDHQKYVYGHTMQEALDSFLRTSPDCTVYSIW